ncbi:ParB/RepB/Spo0J family partition protein [Lacibacter cauensis]|uniref:ParB/RepB/Spo0J family partition protein n=1 Tax=Lacibacter cauensis TaxID=510947 RepID=A0A562SHY2_9BACT|nr:ParB/RepB/Spo0J family partition protein [Lacibacter cauensis]TWI80544.1 ParB/RepB/Spo0J family partition protein [Lacibacter cauensis]
MLLNIPIGNITALPNYRQIDEDPAELEQLVASVKKDGIFQPVLVRTHKTEPDRYELIFGNRRFAAAQLAQLETIPAQVKEVADDNILEVQVIENLQRKDVHPMDEAAAYKAYKEKNGCDVKELAAKFSKPERYIAHRLALTTLIPELQKDFLKKQLTIAQAEVFAKLNPEQQKELMKAETQYGTRYASSVADLHDEINRLFLHDLGKAPFDKNDATLLPKAGACSSCQKRTACRTLLFEDVAKEDHCLDGKCFSMKIDLHLVKKANDIIAHEPNIAFAVEQYSDNPPKRIIDEAKKMKVPVYTNGYYDHKWGKFTDGRKVFMLNGSKKGKIVTVYFQSKEKGKGSNEEVSTEMQIAAINQRLERSEELLYEKYMEKVNKFTDEFINNKAELGSEWKLELSTQFDVLTRYLWFLTVDKWDDEFLESIGLTEKEEENYAKFPEQLYIKLLMLDKQQQLELFAKCFFDQIGRPTSKTHRSYMLEQFAGWIGMDLSHLRFEMNTELEKKRLSATARIEKLQKELPAVKASTKKKKKNEAAAEATQ